MERAVIVSITDSVVKVEHSLSCGSGDAFDKSDEHFYSPIPEALIESCATFTRDPEAGPPAGT